MSKNNNQDQEDDFDQPEVEKSLSPVASIPAKNMLIIGVFMAVVMVMIYNFFFSDSDTPKKEEAKIAANVEVAKPAQKVENALPSIPVLPEPPKIEAPQITDFKQQPAVLPVQISQPTIPTLPSIPAPLPELPEAEERKGIKGTVSKEERLRSSMIVGNDQGNPDQQKKAEQERLQNIVVDSNFHPTKTTAEQVKATRIGDMDSVIAQGKLIDAILETAINTDLQGMVRAIVSRDVYGESGRNILIPKGSRLVGVYSAEVKRGQKRVMMAWNRVIRPDGLDVILNSPGIDQIGRAGIEGFVDNKNFEILTNALLLSIINVAVAFETEKQAAKRNIETATPANTTTTTNTPQTGTTQTTTQNQSTTLSNQAVTQGAATMHEAMKKVVSDTLDERPTITIDQGSRLKVFVKRDLLFPSSAGSIKIIN